MSFSRGIAVALLIGLPSACGGSHTDGVAAGGSGTGSAGSAGMQALAGGGGRASNAGGGGAAAFGGSVDIGAQASSDKLDVLFVIDNSSSMLGKQQILAKSAQSFVSRLTNPLCVDAQGKPADAQPTGPTAACASGTREFKPIADIHFGAITTSIGSHGGNVCTNQGVFMQQDDQAQLLPSKRTGLASYQDSGFLAFDATGAAGEPTAAAVSDGLSAMITAAGQQGCGYEAPLEAMYRFLVDPEPPLSVEVVNQVSTPMGINDLLLGQRRAFLRPDSSLAIVIFSDENDCSIKDSELGWFVASLSTPGSSTPVRMPRATSACEVDPNDACCRSCAASEASPPSGCSALTQDSVCGSVPVGQAYASYDVLNDSANLRCFEQQRRFGFDLLHPIARYRDALSNPKIQNRAGQLVDNPLLAARDGKGPRSATLVSVAVIAGAPWQDLATTESVSGGPLEFLDAASLESNGRWPLLIGDEKKNVAASDPFMIESIDPRTGQNPLTMTPIAPATSANPQQNPINGHERNNPDRADLQFACTFPLPNPIDCAPGMVGCDCAPDKSGDTSFVTAENSPLCQPPGGGAAGSTQYYGKAYPGRREFQFARLMGARAVSSSMCPRTTSNDSRQDYGYVAAFQALLGRIGKTVK